MTAWPWRRQAEPFNFLQNSNGGTDGAWTIEWGAEKKTSKRLYQSIVKVIDSAIEIVESLYGLDVPAAIQRGRGFEQLG